MIHILHNIQCILGEAPPRNSGKSRFIGIPDDPLLTV